MESKTLFRETIKAGALGDSQRAVELNSRIPEEERDDFNDHVSAVFCAAVENRLREDHSLPAIKEFVNEFRYDFREADPPVKVLVAEALIRVFYGEEHLIDEIDGAEQIRHQLMIIRKIVDQSQSIKNQLDEFLIEAQKLTEAED